MNGKYFVRPKLFGLMFFFLLTLPWLFSVVPCFPLALCFLTLAYVGVAQQYWNIVSWPASIECEGNLVSDLPTILY